MMIEAVINGPTPRSTIDKLVSPPPEKMFRNPKNWLFERNCGSCAGLTPGTGIDVSIRKTIKIARMKTIRKIIVRSVKIDLHFLINV
jgi:hypothetical protein